jgi:branched-chain amino acid transport system substrate-binding protein
MSPSVRRFRRIWAVWAVLLTLTSFPAAQTLVAQDAIPRIVEAESVFDQALRAFQQGDYGMAYRRFRIVYTDHPLNRRTTAAMLMAGKALVRDGEVDRGIQLLQDLRRTYPSSGYLAEADRTIEAARARQSQAARAAQTIQLGIALPMTGADAALTQEMFNGIRLAVDEHNAASERKVRMIFRDTRNDPRRSREAIQALVDAGVDVIIGPLFSEEALAAAEVAERAGVVLIAPMATDEAVAQGRRYVFQANPTLVSRGRALARYMVNTERQRTFGVVTELANNVAERMAEGFQDEALLLGADVRLYRLIPTTRGWSTLVDDVGAEILEDAANLYMPMAGGNVESHIRNVLGGLQQENVRVRVLGNAEWRGRVPSAQSDRFGIIYEDDFHVSASDERAFRTKYSAVSTQAPGRLAYGGYDVTWFALARLTGRGSRPLVDAFRQADVFQGIGTRIHFRGGNTNQAVFIHRLRNGQAELLQ